MAMSEEHREAVKAANKRRGVSYCRSCSQSGVVEKDGGECGGLPGVKYRVCNGCGAAHAITRRQCRFKL